VGEGRAAGAARPARRRAEAHKKGVVTEEAKRYWAYQPVRRPSVPEVRNPNIEIRNPIDAFVAAKWEAKGLKPVKPADKAALIRRATYDLTGLPPTPDEVDAFVAGRVAGRLREAARPPARVAAVRREVGPALARRGPLRRDQRVRARRPQALRVAVPRLRHQELQRRQAVRRVREGAVAGDELPGYNPDAVVATGFYRLGIWDDEPADPLQAVFDGYDDLVATVGQGFLGTTFNCARCHDHKADPVPQTDYYKLVAFMRDIRPYSETRDVRSAFNLTDISPPEQRAKYAADLEKRQARLAEIRKLMEAAEDAVIKTLPAEDQRASEGPGPAAGGGEQSGPGAEGRRERRLRRAEEGAGRAGPPPGPAGPAARAVGEQLRPHPAARRTCSSAGRRTRRGRKSRPGSRRYSGCRSRPSRRRSPGRSRAGGAPCCRTGSRRRTTR
jgi:hypothetical protein